MPEVTQSLPNFYAQWRVQSGLVLSLQEDRDSPPEYLLQAIWQHQRLLREQLNTLDGQPVQILHPGFRSLEGGPDFRNAVVQFGDEPPRSGDVEVDLRSSGWRAHGHDRNSAFRNVILHVIWEGERQTPGSPAALPLSRALDAPLGQLSLWLGNESADGLPAQWRGRCCAPLRGLTQPELTELFHQAALVRLQSKGTQFQARARQAGWEQALWEGLFRALGYKHNSWPMQRLAELRPRWSLETPEPRTTNCFPISGAEVRRQGPGPDERRPEAQRSRKGKSAGHSFQTPVSAHVFNLQARLLGLSGLLPTELPRRETGTDLYLRRVWDQWWREREEFSDCILPRTLWKFGGLRPANHPQRRLALASHWLATGNLASNLERWCSTPLPTAELGSSLLETLSVGPDDFWSWHCTFRSARFKQAQPLLGPGRVTDLAMNVILPWLWIRATEGKNTAVRTTLEQRYLSWPCAEDNSVLRLARQRLLGGGGPRSLKGAAAQQGLMQIVRDFCDHATALCDNCKLPGLVKEFAAAGMEGSEPRTKSLTQESVGPTLKP